MIYKIFSERIAKAQSILNMYEIYGLGGTVEELVECLVSIYKACLTFEEFEHAFVENDVRIGQLSAFVVAMSELTETTHDCTNEL